MDVVANIMDRKMGVSKHGVDSHYAEGFLDSRNLVVAFVLGMAEEARHDVSHIERQAEAAYLRDLATRIRESISLAG